MFFYFLNDFILYYFITFITNILIIFKESLQLLHIYFKHLHIIFPFSIVFLTMEDTQQLVHDFVKSDFVGKFLL